ncbi:MAG: DinB family protein [Candidatus Thorarchaeota archaeon]
MELNVAQIGIASVEIAECNLLHSLMGLSSDQIYASASPMLNSIGWIFGHCAVHYHWVVNLTCQNTRFYSEELCEYFRYGTTKDEISRIHPPLSFRNLLDTYLNMSDCNKEYLRGLEPSEFYQAFAGNPSESLLETLYRMAYHYMGHMGQIVMLRRLLGNPGPSFVDGITLSGRERIMKEWRQWWEENKLEFDI